MEVSAGNCSKHEMSFGMEVSACVIKARDELGMRFWVGFGLGLSFS